MKIPRHDVIASSREQFPELLSTEIPYSSEIERMSLRREPLSAYSPRGVVGQIYSLLWKEIGTRMQHSSGAAPATADLAVAASTITPADVLDHNDG